MVLAAGDRAGPGAGRGRRPVLPRLPPRGQEPRCRRLRQPRRGHRPSGLGRLGRPGVRHGRGGGRRRRRGPHRDRRGRRGLAQAALPGLPDRSGRSRAPPSRLLPSLAGQPGHGVRPRGPDRPLQPDPASRPRRCGPALPRHPAGLRVGRGDGRLGPAGRQRAPGLAGQVPDGRGLVRVPLHGRAARPRRRAPDPVAAGCGHCRGARGRGVPGPTRGHRGGRPGRHRIGAAVGRGPDRRTGRGLRHRPRSAPRVRHL